MRQKEKISHSEELWEEAFLIFYRFWNIAFDKPKHQGWHDKIAKTLVIKRVKKSLVLPVILSIIAFCFSIWIIYFWEDAGYDFSYLGSEATVINLIQERIYQQDSSFQLLIEKANKTKNLSDKIPTKQVTDDDKTAEEIFREYSRAIVTIGIEDIYGDYAFGSGFLISPTGLIVTNYHVIENANRVAVAIVGQEINTYDISSVVVIDFVNDIAVLDIRKYDLPYVFLGNSDLTEIGEKVFAIGNPEGFTNTISDGIVSQFREYGDGIISFQITAPISFGSSGGALFNKKGDVIGITDSIFTLGQNINFAIPINYVKSLIGLEQDSDFIPEELNYNASNISSDEYSNLILCNSEYWQPCSSGYEFNCPPKGEPICCPVGSIFCNNECWEKCPTGQRFRCPSLGSAYCE